MNNVQLDMLLGYLNEGIIIDSNTWLMESIQEEISMFDSNFELINIDESAGEKIKEYANKVIKFIKDLSAKFITLIRNFIAKIVSFFNSRKISIDKKLQEIKTKIQKIQSNKPVQQEATSLHLDEKFNYLRYIEYKEEGKLDITRDYISNEYISPEMLANIGRLDYELDKLVDQVKKSDYDSSDDLNDIMNSYIDLNQRIKNAIDGDAITNLYNDDYNITSFEDLITASKIAKKSIELLDAGKEGLNKRTKEIEKFEKDSTTYVNNIAKKEKVDSRFLSCIEKCFSLKMEINKMYISNISKVIDKLNQNRVNFEKIVTRVEKDVNAQFNELFG